MVVGGVPTPRPDHAEAVADMALALQAATQDLLLPTGKAIQLRIGIHSGPVTAGVIGTQKFAYDLWGDTVNTASRMESHGEVGRVHVSQSTRDILGDTFRFAERGEVTKGSIELAGERIDKLSPNDVVKRGCIQVMEGRHCFGHLTIEENLLTGAFTRRAGRAEIARDLEAIYAYFPRLAQRRAAMAGYTSGGEQQMCAIGRAMMSKPNMILLDEPSMGLAPQIVEEIFDIVKNLNAKEGVSFLLAEQNTNIALRYAHYGYILENGRVVLDGAAEALRGNEDVKEFYLGLGAAGRKSFREVKHYKRRKRWLADRKSTRLNSSHRT